MPTVVTVTKKEARRLARAAEAAARIAAEEAVMNDPDKAIAFERGHQTYKTRVRSMDVTPYGIAVSFHSLPPKIVLALLDTAEREIAAYREKP